MTDQSKKQFKSITVRLSFLFEKNINHDIQAADSTAYLVLFFIDINQQSISYLAQISLEYSFFRLQLFFNNLILKYRFSVARQQELVSFESKGENVILRMHFSDYD